MKIVLIGGPLDGQVTRVPSHLREWQRSRTLDTYYVYRLVHNGKTPVEFHYAGIGPFSRNTFSSEKG